MQVRFALLVFGDSSLMDLKNNNTHRRLSMLCNHHSQKDTLLVLTQVSLPYNYYGTLQPIHFYSVVKY
jgi:hypothetical protein